MASTGILVVSNVKQIAKSLHSIQKYVSSLYIHLNVPQSALADPAPVWGRLISQLYADSNKYVGNRLDLRILVGPLKGNGIVGSTLKPVDMIFSDSHFPEICDKLRSDLNISSQTIFLQDTTKNDIVDYKSHERTPKIHNTVVLGGTFDRIHVGHKIFLTQAVLRSARRLVVGVTTSKMTKSKTLPELILPVGQRIQDVQNFLMDIDSSLHYEIVPIDDPFGPTQTDPDMDLIVVSAETLRGGHKVNEIRTSKNLRPLEIHSIDVVKSNDDDDVKESKISSSNTRIDLLGTRIRKVDPRPHLSQTTYIIGLTGGIASGKSKMAQRFENKGAVVIDCDKIGHEIYEPGQVCYDLIVKHFGEEILNDKRRIDRTKLGPIVFGNPEQLEVLNGIVWPELISEVKRRISALHSTAKVVILEAAVLLKAGWQSECHEVWSMIIPPEVAKRRIVERNGLSEDEAIKRIASQLPNSEIVAKSNVVFSSQWDAAFTQKQADRAWSMLMNELDNKTSNL